jgi:hypothetical protein
VTSSSRHRPGSGSPKQSQNFALFFTTMRTQPDVVRF